MQDIYNLKEQLAQTIRAYHLKGWSPATSTNYSFRENPASEVIFVSRSGMDKSQFHSEDFMRVAMDGNPVLDDRDIKPSAETLIHCELYRLFPESTVVLHSHSVYSVLNSQLYDDRISFEGYEIQKGFDGQTTHVNQIHIPILSNSQNMIAFSALMLARKEEFKHHAFVIRNHGTYAWGKNLFEAKRHLETLEYLLEVNYKLEVIKK
jgi:methylthioribulose-1-phosphate dehydratase